MVSNHIQHKLRSVCPTKRNSIIRNTLSCDTTTLKLNFGYLLEWCHYDGAKSWKITHSKWLIQNKLVSDFLYKLDSQNVAINYIHCHRLMIHYDVIEVKSRNSVYRRAKVIVNRSNLLRTGSENEIKHKSEWF